MFFLIIEKIVIKYVYKSNVILSSNGNELQTVNCFTTELKLLHDVNLIIKIFVSSYI